MKTRERATISLPADLMVAAKASAGGNLSAYVEEAVREKQLREAGRVLVAWRGRAGADGIEELADLFGEEIA